MVMVMFGKTVKSLDRGGVHSLACLDRKRVLEFFSPLAVGGCKTASCFWFRAFDPVSSVQTKRRGFSRDLNPERRVIQMNQKRRSTRC